MELLTPEAREKATAMGDRVCCYCPKTGAIRYESAKWESVRSDSHQVVAKAGSDLHVQGSPARVCGDGDAVFGSGASAALDLSGSLQRMVAHLETYLGCSLPPASCWGITRCDVTGNLKLASLAEVRVALSILRGVEGGRYKVNAQQGDTVYWNRGSKLRAGKAYAKGPHLRKMQRAPDYSGRMYTDDELKSSECLLRLELTLAREWFSRHPWKLVTAEMLREQWNEYFLKMIGGAEIVNDSDVQEKIVEAAKCIAIATDKKTGEIRFGTELMGRSAFGCWCIIRAEGWEKARDIFHNNKTWYRHLQIIRAAGLADADISAGRVVQLRRRILEVNQVNSWAEAA